MAIAQFLYRKADNVFLWGGFYDVQNPDPALYGIVEFGDADMPDRMRHRFDAITGKRLATAEELAVAADADLDTLAQRTSRQKDILAMVAFIVRQSNVTAWNAMTLAQKRAAVLSGADVWRDIRVFIEKQF